MATGFGFATLKFIRLVYNFHKMDRFSYVASFLDLRSQITDVLNTCRFLPIREVFGLQNTDLDLSEDVTFSV